MITAMSPRFKPVAMLPTLCTLGNTFCGFLALAKCADAVSQPDRFVEHVVMAAAMIFLAMVFDALDGKIARITNQASDFGAQLDSLTDLVTFGVAPALLTKILYEHTMVAAGLPVQGKVVLVITFLYAVCALLRLARFTIETDVDDEAHEKFFGLPSPAAAGVVAATTFLIFEPGSPLAEVESTTRVRLVQAMLWSLPVLGLLMVSRVEYVHVVSRWFRGRRPFFHLLAVLVVLFLIASAHEVAFFVVFGGYAIAGPILAMSERMLGRKLLDPGTGDDEEDLDGERELPVQVLVALGSNLGDRNEHLHFAIERLKTLPKTELLAVSGFLETEPVGGPPQRPFLNGVVALKTRLSPTELLARLVDIERLRGRERKVKDGPRTLDLDLVLYGGVICESPELVLPHPRFRERSFVLDPAAEVAPRFIDPVTGKDLATLRAELRAKSRA
jgi:CDP-diacylglycerol---serine O-phosphatidyltransferase